MVRRGCACAEGSCEAVVALWQGWLRYLVISVFIEYTVRTCAACAIEEQVHYGSQH